MTRRLLREAALFGLAPGLVTAGVTYLLDLRLLGRDGRGFLLLGVAAVSVALAFESLRSPAQRELEEAVDQYENVGYDANDRLGGKSIEEAAAETTGGFWPRSVLRRRLLFYTATVAVGCGAAFVVLL